MAVDALAMPGARASAAIILTYDKSLHNKSLLS